MNPFKRLSTRIALVFAVLLLLVQLAALFVIHRTHHEHAHKQLAEELATGELVFRRTLAREREQLERAVSAAAEDQTFQWLALAGEAAVQAEALTGRFATLQPVAAALIGLNGNYSAHSLGRDRIGTTYTHPHLFGVAEPTGVASEFIVMADGRLALEVVAAINPRKPLAWLALTFPFDQKLLAELRTVVSLDISFINGKNGEWQLVSSTLADTKQAALAQHLRRRGIGGPLAGLGDLTLDSETFAADTVSLPGYGDTKFAAVLSRSLTHALAGYLSQRQLLLLLAAISIGIVVIASLLLAARITLALAATDMGAGNYKRETPIPRTGPDEIGELASAFSAMREAVIGQQEQITHLAFNDPLTKLPNRHSFQKQLEASLASHGTLAVLLMDIDRFKQVNDTLGHTAGDALLSAVASRLASLAAPGMVARLGGDEFGILLPNASRDAAEATARSVVAILEAPVVLESQYIDVMGSVGVALAPDHGTTPVALLRNADIAMYQAKRGRFGYAIYDSLHDINRRENLSLLGDLKRATEGGQLKLYVQPKIAIQSRQVHSVECLVRWHHAGGRVVPPGEFIPFAEQTGYVRMITRWMLVEALTALERWDASGSKTRVAVNISARDLHDTTFADFVIDAIDRRGLPHDRLGLEITESSLMEDPTLAEQVVQRLATAGFALSIDDYGTGYCSLTYIKRLPIQELKIDQSFVAGMVQHRGDAAIVRSSIELGHSLGLHVVAEGVETDQQLALLGQWGCESAQGFYIARPMLVEDFDDWLKSWNEAAALAASSRYAAAP
jgi:diguanylate cyclase (GGDEF)-like protein